MMRKKALKIAHDILKKSFNKKDKNVKEETIDEMDKSQPASGRAADYPLGVKNKDANMVKKPSETKKVKKDALDVLNKAFNKEDLPTLGRPTIARRMGRSSGGTSGAPGSSTVVGGTCGASAS